MFAVGWSAFDVRSRGFSLLTSAFAPGWLCWRIVGALWEPCRRFMVALGSQSVGYQ
jgi:hypothetical protein